MTTTMQSAQVTPYQINVPGGDVEDLRDRLARTRWPQPRPEDGWARGVPQGELRALTGYWCDGYDWRAQEAVLNAYPQYRTSVDGQTIHFLHVRSGQPGATALLLTHGYPSSVAEFGALIDPLVHPGTGPAFDLVIPSLPGPGWAMGRVARAWVELMRRLGYARYGVHGGEVGAGVS